jgi:hypothetical protein
MEAPLCEGMAVMRGVLNSEAGETMREMVKLEMHPQVPEVEVVKEVAEVAEAPESLYLPTLSPK